MGKKESPEKKPSKKEAGLDSAPKIPGISLKAFSVIKLILGVCLLPFVYSTSKSFLNEFSLVDAASGRYFWLGVYSLLIVYLFVWEPAPIYLNGQKILEVFFTFFKPLVRVAPFLLPIYLLLLMIIYAVVSLFSPSQSVVHAFVFLFGFSIALHLIFSAKSLRTKQQDFLKANYLFGFSFVYILNLGVISLFFSLIFDKFSFINFCNQSYQFAANMFSVAFAQLFIPKVK